MGLWDTMTTVCVWVGVGVLERNTGVSENKHCVVRFHFVQPVVAPVALFLTNVQPSSTWRRIWLSPSSFAMLFACSKSGGRNAFGPPRPAFWGDTYSSGSFEALKFHAFC